MILAGTIDEVCSEHRHGAFALGIDLLVRSSPTFAEALASAEASRLQLAYAAIELLWPILVNNPQYLGNALAVAPLKRVGNEVFGGPRPGLRRALERVGPFPLPRGAYRLLGATLACPVRRKVIFHAKQVSSSLLMVLDILPSAAVSGRVLAWDISDPSAIKRLSYVVGAAEKVLPAAQAADAWRSLAAMDDMQNLDNWFRDSMAAVALPAPPWSGSEVIRPISSPKELKDVARRFQNCVWDSFSQHMSGHMHTYVCQAAGVSAIAAVKPDPFFGWVLTDILGPRNHAVPQEARDYLVREFAKAGIRQAVDWCWCGDRGAW